MKTLAITAIFPVMFAASIASASPMELVYDPSGAPMCADAQGFLAPLSGCAQLIAEDLDPTPVATRVDPSGAPMCFAANGEQVPLARCEDAGAELPVAGFHLAIDPSGASMCFAANGDQAPLSSCDQRHLVGLWAGLNVFAR